VSALTPTHRVLSYLAVLLWGIGAGITIERQRTRWITEKRSQYFLVSLFLVVCWWGLPFAAFWKWFDGHKDPS
jgi:hypothetical protein